MSSKPDPKKAMYLKPSQRRLRPQAARKSPWTPHTGTAALDAWGTAMRDMRQAGTYPDQQS